MKDISDRNSELFPHEGESTNLLWEYVSSLSSETINHLSKPTSNEVFQVMEHNITGILGNLPSDHFDVSITTSRENFGRMLASAMISGYFLRNAEQRLDFEKSIQATDTELAN
jgi:hypothetical protein